ncbi:PH domain-containing protein [Aquimarina sp. 2201CG14-23]|uniref:PH domain-containing protein n=1 Tax=Aquimarina mycalae TaxID=3040073 RepID=UPI002477D52A|nr:PH domain-containing protein [Aquimarina sp. 2201CG14-23]MDH7445839.1 PH domain-containing protein [Aquimarina sp. 2201CG14-23]
MMNTTINQTTEEKMIWTGTPSQWVNLPFYILCVPLTLAFGVGLLLALWKYYDTKLNKLEITNQRVIEYRGILSRTTDELELYRVKDLKHEQPFFLRILGLSNIVLDTTDHSNALLKIKGIASGKELKEQLRQAVDRRRDVKGVREVDFK